MMYDGDLFTSGNIVLGSGFGTTAYFTLKTFTTPPVVEWDPEWVEIKMKYEVPVAATDDKYKIEYSTNGITWTLLEDNGGLKYGTFSSAIRPWSQVDEPQDGTWTWADISSLQVRIYCNKAGLGWDNKKMYIYELWVTVYPAPPPPTTSTTISVQPDAVTRLRPYDYMLGGVQGLCFVEIYVNDVADLFGYQFVLYFDTRVLTPYDAFSYYPWTTQSVHDLNDVGGYVSMAYIMPTVAVGEAFYGNSPVARVYFIVDAYGGGGGGGAVCDLALSTDPLETILSDSTGTAISFTSYDGWFSGSLYWSYQGSLYPGGDPTGTQWHELYPQYCNMYTVTGWTDNTDGDLTASDQIEVYNQTDGTTSDYHVDQVTVTIHWTLKPDGVNPTGYDAASEPLEPIWPMGDPTGSYWHMIYPDFCRWFMITSWEDTGAEPGVFDPSDQFDFEFLDEGGVTYWAHLYEVTTDILVSEKPGVPPVPEFPLGLEILMIMAAAIPIIYIWRTRKWAGKR